LSAGHVVPQKLMHSGLRDAPVIGKPGQRQVAALFAARSAML
jgi:hypothetical protein